MPKYSYLTNITVLCLCNDLSMTGYPMAYPPPGRDTPSYQDKELWHHGKRFRYRGGDCDKIGGIFSPEMNGKRKYCSITTSSTATNNTRHGTPIIRISNSPLSVPQSMVPLLAVAVVVIVWPYQWLYWNHWCLNWPSHQRYHYQITVINTTSP